MCHNLELQSIFAFINLKSTFLMPLNPFLRIDQKSEFINEIDLILYRVCKMQQAIIENLQEFKKLGNFQVYKIGFCPL